MVLISSSEVSEMFVKPADEQCGVIVGSAYCVFDSRVKRIGREALLPHISGLGTNEP